MKLVFFPGCSALESGREYDSSIRAVCKELNVELIDLQDWNCCGADVTYSFDRNLGVEVAGRNLALAENLGEELMVACNGCYQSFSKAVNMLDKDPVLREETLNTLRGLGLKYEGKIRIRHILDIIINDIGLDAVSAKVSRILKGLRVAPYYGCALVKPQYPNSFDDPENPQSLDELTKALGAEPVPYIDKVRCCGGALILRRDELALNASKRLLLDAKNAGAQCLVTPCPLCHLNLDLMQARIESTFNVEINLPIFYFTQLMGLAFKIDYGKLGLGRHAVSPRNLLKSLNLL